ncbi:MAG: hypothetical protein ABIS44_09955 [Mycobacteriales bacterium]
MPRGRLSAALAVAAVVLSACSDAAVDAGGQQAAGGRGAADYIGAAEQVQSVPAIAAACPAARAARLPKDPPADRVHLCTIELRRVAGDGEWMFAQVRRVTAGADQLFTAYAGADEKHGDGACISILKDPRMIWLHTSPITMVRAPRDQCGFPRPDAEAAYEALTTELVSETRVRQIQSQVAIDSGCSQSWKDILSIEALAAKAAPAGAPSPLPPGATRLCRYAVRLDDTGDRVGELTSGERLTADRVRAINAALVAATPDTSCRRDGHQAFVVMESETYVALDGCAVQQGNQWWRATDELRALLK